MQSMQPFLGATHFLLHFITILGSPFLGANIFLARLHLLVGGLCCHHFRQCQDFLKTKGLEGKAFLLKGDGWNDAENGEYTLVVHGKQRVPHQCHPPSPPRKYSLNMALVGDDGGKSTLDKALFLGGLGIGGGTLRFTCVVEQTWIISQIRKG